MRFQFIVLLLLVYACSGNSTELKDVFLKKESKGKLCDVKANRRFGNPLNQNSENNIILKEDFVIEGVEFKKGDMLIWDRTKCSVGRIRFREKSIFGGYHWFGMSEADDRSKKRSYQVYLHSDKFAPKFGQIAENVEQGGRIYKKRRFVCIDHELKIENILDIDARDINLVGVNLSRDNCFVEGIDLLQETEIEGVVWKKGTSFKFDKNGKWVYVRVRPGQKYEGKVYKDGAKFFRGKDYSSHKDGSLQIMTPEDDMYDKVIVD